MPGFYGISVVGRDGVERDVERHTSLLAAFERRDELDAHYNEDVELVAVVMVNDLNDPERGRLDPDRDLACSVCGFAREEHEPPDAPCQGSGWVDRKTVWVEKP